jgi:hypothetical protein
MRKSTFESKRKAPNVSGALCAIILKGSRKFTDLLFKLQIGTLHSRIPEISRRVPTREAKSLNCESGTDNVAIFVITAHSPDNRILAKHLLSGKWDLNPNPQLTNLFGGESGWHGNNFDRTHQSLLSCWLMAT